MKYDGKRAMRTNETIIAVPTTVEQQGQTRQFLVRLVEKLDIVLGYRGGDPYVSISQLQSTEATSAANLTKLEQAVLKIVTDLLSSNSEVITSLIESIGESTESAIEALKSSDTVANADESTQTITNPPTQAEVQNIQDQVVANADSLNDLLIALRGTGIIAT